MVKGKLCRCCSDLLLAPRCDHIRSCPLSPSSLSTLLISPFFHPPFFPMRKLFTRDKPKLAKVTPASRDVPPDLTSANTSEVIDVTTSSFSRPFPDPSLLHHLAHTRLPFFSVNRTSRPLNRITPISKPSTSSVPLFRLTTPITTQQHPHPTMIAGTSLLRILTAPPNHPSSCP